LKPTDNHRLQRSGEADVFEVVNQLSPPAEPGRYPMGIVTTSHSQNDIRGNYIAEIWQRIVFNDDGMDYCDNYFRLNNGFVFLLPFDHTVRLEYNELPCNAERFDDDHLAPVFASPIVDLLCPKDARFADADTSFLRLESGLWISQVSGYPTGVLATGVFHGYDDPWHDGDEPCPLSSYFKADG
jgi:hypothetical protein